MTTTIYVGNLPFESSEVDIEALFAPFGEVESVRFGIDHSSSNGPCYAFVDMQKEDAEAAARTLDGTGYRGQGLVVTVDQEGKRRSKRDHRRGHEESGSRRRRKPQSYSDSDGNDEDEDEERNDRDDDGWWGDQEDTSWYGLRGRSDEEDEAGS